MSEHVERPFLDQLRTLGWTVVDQGNSIIPPDPRASLRTSFREWLLATVFRDGRGLLNEGGVTCPRGARKTRTSARPASISRVWAAEFRFLIGGPAAATPHESVVLG